MTSSTSIPLLENLTQSKVVKLLESLAVDLSPDFEVSPIENESYRELFKSKFRGTDRIKCHEGLKEKFGIPLKYSDVKTLKDKVWLNDEIVNFYMFMVEELHNTKHIHKEFQIKVFSSFFMDRLKDNEPSPSSTALKLEYVKKWTKKCNIFEYSRIFIPINSQRSHWSLAVVWIREQKVMYFDSLHRKPENLLDSILLYLEFEWKQKGKGQFCIGDWEMLDMPDRLPRQNEGDCGVFTLMYAHFLSENADLSNIDPKKTAEYRKKILSACMKQTLLKDGSSSNYEDLYFDKEACGLNSRETALEFEDDAAPGDKDEIEAMELVEENTIAQNVVNNPSSDSDAGVNVDKDEIEAMELVEENTIAQNVVDNPSSDSDASEVVDKQLEDMQVCINSEKNV